MACRRWFVTIVFIDWEPLTISNSNVRTQIFACAHTWAYSIRALVCETVRRTLRVRKHSSKVCRTNKMTNWPNHLKGRICWTLEAWLFNNTHISQSTARNVIDTKRNCRKNVRNVDQSHKSKYRKHVTNATKRSNALPSFKYTWGHTRARNRSFVRTITVRDALHRNTI